MLTVILLLALSQGPEASDQAPPEEAPAGAEAPAPPAGDAPAPAPAAPVRNRVADEVQRAAKKAQELPPEARPAALEELQKQFGGLDINPVLPPKGWDMGRFMELTPQDQARVVARRFFEDLIAGDGRAMVAASGLPFALEDRRIERIDELRSEWARILRSRRADLLTLYSMEILTPAEMEKKYGRPPQRLSRWDTRGPNTFLAVGNLSGHAAVLLLRQVGITWQVLGFHD
ncbi:MAG: hypothetical protein AB1730_21995 [Myxococcota bacterium]|jgi:hypothetical protein